MAQARRYKKKKTPAWVWLFIGFLLGFFFSHVDFLAAYKFLEASFKKNSHARPGQAAQKAPKTETTFDFYHILSDKPVERESRPAAVKTVKASHAERIDHFSGEPESLSKRYNKKEELTDLDAPTQAYSPRSKEKMPTVLPPLKKQMKVDERPALPSQDAKLFQKKKPDLPQNSTLKGATQRLAKEQPMKVEQEVSVKKPEKFTLQIAALRGFAEADQLKAELLMMGFQSVRIQKIKRGSSVLFRVTMGQYTQQREAESVKRRLQQSGMKGVVVPD